MSYADIVFQSMPFGREVTAEHLSEVTHLKIKDVGQALTMLANGGVIEQTVSDYFIKKRKYKSKQKSLPLGR